MTIFIKDLNQYEPVENIPWQVHIDNKHNLYTPFKLKDTTKKSQQFAVLQYKRWFQQTCENKGKTLQEMFKLYSIYKKYGILELFFHNVTELHFSSVIREFLENALIEDCYEKDSIK